MSAKETVHELATVPNALTLARLAYSPRMVKRLHDNPGGYWHKAAAVMLSDMLDGKLARLGRTSALLATLGFRESETGRKLDPFVDKITTSEVLVAGMHNNTIPKSIGALALAQKAAISGYTLWATAKGAEIHVTKWGKRFEAGINVGLGSFFVAESFADNPPVQQAVRTGAAVLGTASILGAALNDLNYVHQARQQLGRQPDNSSAPTVDLPPASA